MLISFMAGAGIVSLLTGWAVVDIWLQPGKTIMEKVIEITNIESV
jgi:hypothetical protein